MARTFIQLGNYVCTNWTRLDRGMWEMRGPDRAFTASKVAAWQALDRCIRAARAYGLDAPSSRWAAGAEAIHDEVCERASTPSATPSRSTTARRTSMRACSSFRSRASCRPDDPRCVGTIDAVARELMEDGLLLRYRPEGRQRRTYAARKGRSWPVRSGWCRPIARSAVVKEAEALFQRLAALCNDVGLLAEEYDPKAKRQLGNFPQAFSHLALIQAAFDLEEARQKQLH